MKKYLDLDGLRNLKNKIDETYLTIPYIASSVEPEDINLLWIDIGASTAILDEAILNTSTLG